MEEGVVGADFRDRLRAIYGERRFNCDVTCNASNGASFTTSFSRHNIQTGVGRHVSYLTSLGFSGVVIDLSHHFEIYANFQNQPKI